MLQQIEGAFSVVVSLKAIPFLLLSNFATLQFGCDAGDFVPTPLDFRVGAVH